MTLWRVIIKNKKPCYGHPVTVECFKQRPHNKVILVFKEKKMINISVYVVVNLTINDKDEYRIYEKGFFPLLKKHNGTFITFDDSPEVLEGPKPLPGRAIIFSFPVFDIAFLESLTESEINLCT